jgi:hypothetical protein
VSTRKISAKTASLSGIRSITPFEITTSKLVFGNGSCSASLSTNSTFAAAISAAAARLRQHLGRHVDPGDVALLADHLRGDERVGAGAGAEVEHPLTRREPAELPRVCDPGERADGGLRHVRELLRIAKVFGPGAGRSGR